MRPHFFKKVLIKKTMKKRKTPQKIEKKQFDNVEINDEFVFSLPGKVFQQFINVGIMDDFQLC